MAITSPDKVLKHLLPTGYQVNAVDAAINYWAHDMKKVSVVIPAYNKVHLTIRTINSVLAQTYGELEIIVIDDGSTDDTASRLKMFEGQIIYFRKPNGGACSARNVGLQKATGEYVAFIDCDDIYYPNKIEKCVQVLDADPGIGFVYNRANLIDANDDVISEHKILQNPPSGWITPALILDNFICNSTVVARKECFDQVGSFDETIFIPADWDMWIRLSEKYKAGYVDENLTGYRLTQSYTAANMEQAISEAIYVLDKIYRRNSDLPKQLKKQSLSKLYFSYGLNYAVAERFKKAVGSLKMAIQNRPVALKATVFMVGIVLAPHLMKKLILRLSPSRKYLIPQE